MQIQNVSVFSCYYIIGRDSPILPAKNLEKYVGKSKEQNAGKVDGKLEKWAPRNGNLVQKKIKILK